MKKWILKAIVQKLISYLPNASSWNYLFQKYVTKGVNLSDEYFENKITHAKDHLAYFNNLGGSVDGKIVLELGTGWYPVVPLAMYLNGASTIYSLDITPWMTKERIITTLEKYLEWEGQGKLSTFLPNKQEDRWQNVKDAHLKSWDRMEDLCAFFNIEPIVGDARKTPLADESIDYICSNNTFEHIYPNILKGILVEFNRLLKKDGVMSHFIDMSDHFAHFDRSISIYNFLQFSEKSWSIIDNSIQPQNRLRFKDYQQMYDQLGIAIDQKDWRPGDLNALSTVKVAAPFDQYSAEELAISHGYLVTKGVA